jgi:alanine racemase
MDKKSHSTWVEVDLSAIQDNVELIRIKTGAQVMAIVKANGYGHGAVAVARAALLGGATWCGVARLEEGLELRRAGLDCPLLILGYTPPGVVKTAIQNQISMTVWSNEQVRIATQIADRLAIPAHLHLKLDTGMSRLGVQVDAVIELAEYINSHRNIVFEGLFTHYARADEVDQTPTIAQEVLYRQVLDQLTAQGLRPHLLHAANSAASISDKRMYFDMVRLGIAMYGLHPSADCPLPDGFRQALSWKAVISNAQTLPAGRGISYGHEYVTRRQENIGTIPVGYADGYRRVLGNQVLIGGCRVPVVGRVCMDQIMVQLDGTPNAKVGDEVVLLGVQDNERITAEEIAAAWGTNNYEVVCGIGARVPRFYF